MTPSRRMLGRVALLLGVSAAVASLALLVWMALLGPVIGGFSDSAEYVVLADFFLGHFTGALQQYSANYYGVSRFPPLYPLTLAIAGAGMEASLRAHWVTVVESAAALALLAAWLKQQLRDTGAAALLFAAFVLLPGWLLLGLNPLSEPLFFALLFACLLVADRWRDGESSPWVLAALVSILPLARSAGLALVVAAIVWFHLHGQRRLRLAALATAMCVPILAWMAYRRILPIDYDYSAQLTLDRVLEVFGGWDGWLLGQWPRMFNAVIDNLDPSRHRYAIPAAGLLLAFGIVGWWLRLRARRLDPLFLVVYLGLVFVWPYPAEQQRLLLVALPFVMLCAADAVVYLAARVRPVSPLLAAAFVAVIVIAPASTFLARVPHRLALDVAPELSSHRATPSFFLLLDDDDALHWLELRERIVQVMSELPGIVPRTDCVYSTSPALAWMVTGGRVSIRPTIAGIETAERARREMGECRYFLVAFITSPQHRQPPLYPHRLIEAWTRPVLLSEFKGPNGENKGTAAALLVRRDDEEQH